MLCKIMVAVEMVSGTAPSMKLHRTLQTTGARHPSHGVMLTDRSKHTKVCSARSVLGCTSRTTLYGTDAISKARPRSVCAGPAAYSAAQ